MKFKLKALWVALPLLFFGLVITRSVNAQETKKPIEVTGCKPSSCRGAKTKFGEAKVITKVRERLVALKSGMEKSTGKDFNARSYDITNLAGESDEESLAIIAREVQLIENEFSKKLNRTFEAFTLPANKAKQVKYLVNRIEELQKLL